jgi:pyruvate dehydrogenase E2 component (dihydrolipoamide acetyltransferase)
MKKYYNIGIAVDSENGLMVPVIKGADQKNIFQLAREIVELAEKVKNREVDLGDLKGGTFTITNIGSLGGIFATPIINYPEVAILAVGRITDRLVVDKEGKIKIRKILPLSLAFDHRVIDGADAAEFMNSIKELLEDPDLLLMQ